MYAADTNASTYAADFITVKGFNLNPSAVRVVDSSTAVTSSVATDSGIAATASDTASDYTSFSLANTIANSGYLEVFTNGVRSLNNINENDAHDAAGSGSAIGSDISDYANYYNREPDYYTTKNVQLTDDRYLVMWDMTSTSLRNGYYPDMVINTKNATDGSGNVVFSYLNPSGGSGMNYSANFQPQRAVVYGTGNNKGTTKSTEYLIGAMAWDQMAMIQDESGRYIHATVYNYNGASMSLIYDKFASLRMPTYYHDGNNSNTDATYAGWGSGTFWSGQYMNTTRKTKNNALNLDSVNYGSLLLDRYKNIRLVSKGSSTDADNPAQIYMAFYDDNTSSVFFRNFMIAPDSSLGNRLYRSSDYNDNNKASDGGNYTQYTNFEENTGNSDTWTNGKSTISSTACEYFDIGVTSDNVAIVVYYDTSAGRLKLMYKTGVDCTTPNTALAFNESTSIELPSYVGQYVSMAVDDQNGIHIAAFDANDSDLKYIYLTSYDATSYTQMTVDAVGSVGNWTSIKIKDNVPYISYYNSTETGSREAIKLAYANAEIGSIADGIDSSTNYTATGWEYLTVPSITPAQGGTTKFRHVCLDFDSNGVPVVGYLGTNLEFGKQRSE